MKTRCPNCGALSSLDALIANDQASEAIAMISKLSGRLGKAWIQYLGLFRPEKSQLTFDRVAKLTSECIRDIELQRIERDGRVFEAPIESWLYAINVCITARNENRLKTPLKSHGYLYEIIAGYKPTAKVMEQNPAEVDSLNLMARGLLK